MDYEQQTDTIGKLLKRLENSLKRCSRFFLAWSAATGTLKKKQL